MMNTAEIKLDLFRKIDELNSSDLTRIYRAILSLLSTTEKHILTNAEIRAINDALECSKKGEIFSHDSVLQDASHKYLQLKFK